MEVEGVGQKEGHGDQREDSDEEEVNGVVEERQQSDTTDDTCMDEVSADPNWSHACARMYFTVINGRCVLFTEFGFEVQLEKTLKLKRVEIIGNGRSVLFWVTTSQSSRTRSLSRAKGRMWTTCSRC